MGNLGDCHKGDQRISGILKGLWDPATSASGRVDHNTTLLKALYRETSVDPVVSLLSPLDQLMIIFSNADFASSDQERVDVAGIFREYAFMTDPLPLISQHSGRDLACRCLISLGLFGKMMESHYKYHAAPKPEFYREVGITEFNCINRRDLSQNFVNWENFFGEFFPLNL